MSSAQTISILSGDGQLVLTNRISSQPLIVQVKDATGKAVPGATVNWAVTGLGNVSTTQTTTDANGQSSTGQFFIAPTLVAPNAFLQSTVGASLTNGATANFVESSYFADPATSVNYVQAFLITPTLSSPLPAGQGGVPGATPVQVQVKAINGSQTGQGVQHVALQIVAENATGPTITCQGGIIYTDTSGTANCTPVFGGVGNGTFSVIVGGGQTTFPSNPFSVAMGNPSIINIVSGNNQSGTPGMTLPATLAASVTDAAGNPIPGIPLTFTAETPGTVTFSNVRGTSDVNGQVFANAILGTIPGTYKIRVATATGTISSEFTFSVNVPISGLSKVSGEPQSALVNTVFASPLVVQVNDATLKGIPGQQVTFAVVQGSATLGTATATTDANGRASTTVTAGAAAGTLVITATSGAFAQTFSLTVSPPGPTCTAANFSNTATAQAGGLAPGAVVTLTCPGVAPLIQGSVVAASLPGNIVPILLASDTVQFNGIYAPVFAVSNVNGQQSITVQVPFEVAPGAANVTVTANGAVETPFGVTIQSFSPGVLEWTMTNNVRIAFVVRPDGTIVNASNPARHNETLRAYAVGLGAVTPAIGTNQLDPIDSDPAVVAQVVVGVNNSGVQVVSATYARNLIGLYEVRFIITDPGTAGPNVPFAIAVASGGSLVFGQPSQLPVQ